MGLDLDTEVKELEKKLGLKSGFLDGLLKEDDWSFVVKLHALIEAAVTHLLIQRLGEDRLDDILSLTELSDPRKGKLAFMRALEIMDTEERQFISTLSQLRNTLVHKIQNVTFQFDTYLKRMDANQRKNFVEAFGFAHDDVQVIKGKEIPLEEYVLGNPKLVLWQAGYSFLGYLQLLADTAQKERRITELRAKAGELALTPSRGMVGLPEVVAEDKSENSSKAD